jgi:hypothetical protein
MPTKRAICVNMLSANAASPSGIAANERICLTTALSSRICPAGTDSMRNEPAPLWQYVVGLWTNIWGSSRCCRSDKV